MRDIKGIVINFENCEWAVFDAPEIAFIAVNGIKRGIQRFAADTIGEATFCEGFFVELRPCANSEYRPFGAEEMPEGTVFRRMLENDDVVSVAVLYTNGTVETIGVPWLDADENGERNALQQSFCSKNGAFYIYIGENGSLWDIIDIDEVNSPEYADRLFRKEEVF